jgi:hypothetical protein
MAQRIDVPGMGIVEFPDGMSDDQISAAIRQNMPQQAAPQAMSNEQADPVLDVAKSAGANLGRGVIDVLGAPGDIGSLAARGAEAVGVPEGARKFAGKALAAFPLTRPFTGPGSQDIQGRVEEHTGKFYDAQTTPGKYVGSVARMAPAALVPGSMAQKVANVAVPGVASEAAGQATEGTAAEPYARAGAALLGGAAASRIGRVNASTAQQAVGSADDRIAAVQGAAERGYQSPAIAAVEFRPGVVDALSTTALRQLDRARFNERLAPQTRGILDDMRQPVNGAAHTVEDLQTARQQLSTIAGNFSNPTEQAAASRAIENITNYLGRMPQNHLARGDAAEAGQAWNTARQNYASARTAEKVQQKLTNADLQAASSNSGANSGNAARQKLRTLLTNPKQGRGLNEAESTLIENTVQGSRMGNALRTGGNLLGGGGGLGALLTGAVGGAAAGPAGLALPLVGRGLKMAGDSMTRRDANRIVDAILSRAPEMQNIQQQGMQTLSDRKRRALIAQLGLAPMPIIKQPAQQPSN